LGGLLAVADKRYRRRRTVETPAASPQEANTTLSGAAP
jgi:hypothetical protein